MQGQVSGYTVILGEFWLLKSLYWSRTQDCIGEGRSLHPICHNCLHVECSDLFILHDLFCHFFVVVPLHESWMRQLESFLLLVNFLALIPDRGGVRRTRPTLFVNHPVVGTIFVSHKPTRAKMGVTLSPKFFRK